MSADDSTAVWLCRTSNSGDCACEKNGSVVCQQMLRKVRDSTGHVARMRDAFGGHIDFGLHVTSSSTNIRYGNSLPFTRADEVANSKAQADAVTRAKADPKSHKESFVFEDTHYRYNYIDAGTNGRGWSVRYCWTTTRNAAGYYITWRETKAPAHSRAEFTGLRNQL